MPVLIPKHGMLRPHGVGILVDPALPHEVQQDTVQCGHCNRHGAFKPGCGSKLGKCQKCMQTVCARCAAADDGACLPFDKRIELYEAGKLATL